MRLLNTSTYALEEFLDVVPPYAVLSHTWDIEEVTFQHIRAGVAEASTLKGFAKVEGFCQQAALAGYEWAWIDTCCVDRSSTAEISEALNSMYGWYQRSAVCIVYLADVPRFRLTDSRWFECGWTLQELIAPKYVEFYTSDWLELGTKSSLEDILSSATGISLDVLRGRSPTECTVAERLSWASGRRTARPEDEAYCLLGLFDIKMPILYGEGARAFERLQNEILRQTEDFTLLAWSPAVNQRDSPTYTGVLAPNPTVFKRPDLTTHLPSTTFGFDDADSMLFADMGTLGWGDLQPHRWDSKSSSFPVHQFLFDPPMITSRGISVTLPIDTDESDHPEGAQNPPKTGEREVLAWIYTNVAASRGGTSPSAPSRGSWGTRRSSVDGSMMVCVWLTVSLAGTYPGAPVRAFRTPGKGPVCVSTMFMSRFKPSQVYLQAGQGPSKAESPGPQVQPAGGSWERALSISFNECPGPRQLKIASHYPPTAIVERPVAGKQDPKTGVLAPSKNGSLWGFHAGQFEVVVSGGRIMNFSGALRVSLTNPSTPDTESSHLVALFGHSPSAQLHCHLEALDQADLDASERDFWTRFLWRRKRRSIHVASGRPSDRSSLVLPCGVAVTAAMKQRLVGRVGGVVIPTLILTTIGDGARVLASIDRLLSNN
ncbi:uncharacterized protein DNG_09540 [Cephalotrichum gorgonifer]|uniref:Heterokaryon incompatibility domain-containing protein n=1 Tax=Cephalotrichum gorgonifer TaxID=2041049 RepID=A0AAE8N5X0_9PEZI|nr:uncharacterized protein DNG_09540 [Cephalotrichum gorgonifer]